MTVLTGNADAVRNFLRFSFPPRDGWGDLAAVASRNGSLAAAALLLASRLRKPSIDRFLILAWTANVALAGAALGAYGDRLVRHTAIYGSLELAGFSLVLASCQRLRREHGAVQGGELFVAFALLAMGAATETIWPWRL